MGKVSNNEGPLQATSSDRLRATLVPVLPAASGLNFERAGYPIAEGKCQPRETRIRRRPEEMISATSYYVRTEIVF